MRHILTILVDNEPGVLARISGLFTARGFNIESLCVAPTENSSLSKITLVTSGEDWVIDQIVKRFSNDQEKNSGVGFSFDVDKTRETK